MPVGTKTPKALRRYVYDAFQRGLIEGYGHDQTSETMQVHLYGEGWVTARLDTSELPDGGREERYFYGDKCVEILRWR